MCNITREVIRYEKISKFDDQKWKGIISNCPKENVEVSAAVPSC